MTDIPGFHCEAKLHGFRRTQDGVVVSFVLHPAEVPSALALDPLGTRYQLGLCAISDDEQPTEPPSRRDAPFPSAAERPGVDASASQTARARASYAALPPMEQARARAGILPSDLRFQQWVASETGGIATEACATAYIRERCCAGGSRHQIADTRACYDLFLTMETDFKVWDGQIAERRG